MKDIIAKFKARIAALLLTFMLWVDRQRDAIEEYDYETAPYCGHHYNGHRGWLTESSYHEGCGGCVGTMLWGVVQSEQNSDVYKYEYAFSIRPLVILKGTTLRKKVTYRTDNFKLVKQWYITKHGKIDSKMKAYTLVTGKEVPRSWIAQPEGF